jgi:hypothetical protein
MSKPIRIDKSDLVFNYQGKCETYRDFTGRFEILPEMYVLQPLTTYGTPKKFESELMLRIFSDDLFEIE